MYVLIRLIFFVWSRLLGELAVERKQQVEKEQAMGGLTCKLENEIEKYSTLVLRSETLDAQLKECMKALSAAEMDLEKEKNISQGQHDKNIE